MVSKQTWLVPDARVGLQQSKIALSSGEAELVAALSGACEGVSLRRQWNWLLKFECNAVRRRCLSSSQAESLGGRPDGPFPATLTTLLKSHMVKVRALGSPQLSLGDRMASRRRNEFQTAFNHRRYIQQLSMED